MSFYALNSRQTPKIVQPAQKIRVPSLKIMPHCMQPSALRTSILIRGDTGLCFCYYSSKRCDPRFLRLHFASSGAMASSPPSSLSPSVFRSSTPSGCPHEKMAAEAPIDIELVEARPPVASREGGEQHLEGDLYKSLNLQGKNGPLQWPRAERVRDPERSGARSGSSSQRTRRPQRAPPPQRAVLTSVRLLFEARFTARAPHLKPLPLSVLELIRSLPAGAASPHQRRQHIPRIISPAPQVLSRTAACTRRESRTQRRQRGCAQ